MKEDIILIIVLFIVAITSFYSYRKMLSQDEFDEVIQEGKLFKNLKNRLHISLFVISVMAFFAFVVEVFCFTMAYILQIPSY